MRFFVVIIYVMIGFGFAVGSENKGQTGWANFLVAPLWPMSLGLIIGEMNPLYVSKQTCTEPQTND